MRFARTALCRFTLAAFAAWSSIAGATDVADRYGKYVNDVIRRAREITDRSAYLKELGLLIDRTSLAQSHLVEATHDIVNINEYARAAATDRSEVCPTTERGTVDFRQTLREVGALQQMINLRVRSLEHVTAFRAIDRSRAASCADATNFEIYDIESLGLQYYIPGTPAVFDGVYVLYVSSGDGKQTEGAETIPIIGSIVRIVHNVDERGSIADSIEHLLREGPSTAEYRRFAQAGCRKASDKFDPNYSEYEKVAKSIEKFTTAMDIATLQRRIDSLDQCFTRYEAEYREFMKTTSDERVKRGLETAYAFRSDLQLKLGTRINSRIVSALTGLRAMTDVPCGKGRPRISAIQADLALGRLYHIEQRSLAERVGRALVERRGKCGAEW